MGGDVGDDRGGSGTQIHQEVGQIINLSSVAGHKVFGTGAVYCATKFAVKAISEGIRLESDGKIRSTNISPGVVATELGLGLAKEGHDIHFITYSQPTRLDFYNERLYYHEVDIRTYPLFQYPPYELALASKMVDVVKYEKLDLLHVH